MISEFNYIQNEKFLNEFDQVTQICNADPEDQRRIFANTHRLNFYPISESLKIVIENSFRFNFYWEDENIKNLCLW